MKPKFRHFLTILICVGCCWLGGRLLRNSSQVDVPQSAGRSVSAPAGPVAAAVFLPPPQRTRERVKNRTTVEIFASCRPDEVILRFPSEETYAAFFATLDRSQIHLVDQLDRLRAVRLSYNDWADLVSLLAGENMVAYDSLSAVPPPTPVGSSGQAGRVELGDGLLPWLGITGDPSRWGAGVKIAVLDTGVVQHPALPGLTKSIAITPFPLDLDQTCGHGTAVASLIAGHGPTAPGIAPAAELISIRISDESGKADSFALAAGILAAIDCGAQLINISMGTSEDNPLIAEAVLLARQSQVLIVAAVGNFQQAEASYPAAYPSVISVGAVDGRGQHLDFSNYGSYLSLTAPGYGINAAWPGNGYTRISGTSASAPIVTGAIAATMSNGRGVVMSASQAAAIVMNYSNEAGLAGPDSEYGVGILDMGRVMNRGVSGRVDAAITSQRLVKSNTSVSHDEIQVTVQNRGTTTLINTQVEITSPFGKRQFNATRIEPCAIQTFSIPIQLKAKGQHEALEVSSKLTLSMGSEDLTPQNNFRHDTLYAD